MCNWTTATRRKWAFSTFLKIFTCPLSNYPRQQINIFIRTRLSSDIYWLISKCILRPDCRASQGNMFTSGYLRFINVPGKWSHQMLPILIQCYTADLLLQVSWRRSNAVAHLCVGSENQPRCKQQTLIFFSLSETSPKEAYFRDVLGLSFSLVLLSLFILCLSNVSCSQFCRWQHGFLVPVLVWTIHVRCRRRGCRTPSNHCLGILKQGTQPSNTHIGPCDELHTHEVCTLPLPKCRCNRLWNGHEYENKANKKLKAMKNVFTDCIFLIKWTIQHLHKGAPHEPRRLFARSASPFPNSNNKGPQMFGRVKLTSTTFPSFDMQLSRMKPKIVKGKEGHCLSGGVDTNFLHLWNL